MWYVAHVAYAGYRTRYSRTDDHVDECMVLTCPCDACDGEYVCMVVVIIVWLSTATVHERGCVWCWCASCVVSL